MGFIKYICFSCQIYPIMKKIIPIISVLLLASQLFSQTEAEINTITSASDKELNNVLMTKIENE